MRLFLAAFALGCALLQIQAELPPPAWLAGMAGAGATGAFWLRRHARVRAAAIAAGGLAAGFVWAALLAMLRLADTLPAELESRDVEVVGIVASLPQRFERGVRFEFAPEQVLTPAARLPSRIQLAWYGEFSPDVQAPRPAVRAGERWRLTVRLKRPHGGANPHGFDYEAWLLERGIRATGYVRPPRASAQPQRLDTFVWGLGTAVDRLREHLRDRLLAALGDAEHGGVIVALAIGDQRAIDGDDWQLFTRTGVGHLMSISGLHVTMIAALGALLTLAAWRRSSRLMLWLAAPRAAAVAGCATALAYCLLAGFAVPAQRTLYMLGVAAWALWQGWFGAGTRVLAIALGVVCLLDPWAPLSPGFWLSFGAVAILMLSGQAARRDAHWSARALQAQLAVTLGLLPLTIALFQQVSLAGPLANALAIPVVSFVVTPLALLACLVPVDAVAQAALWVLDLLYAYLQWLGAHEWSVWQRAAAPLWTVVLAVAGVVWCLLPWWWHWRALGLIWMLPLLLHPPAAPAPGDLWLTVLDVGQGLAVVARTARHTLLFDAGPQYSPEADGGNRVIVPYLRGEGVQRLDALVLSHDDLDHTGGAPSTAGAVPVVRTYSSLRADHPALPPGAPHASCRLGERWAWDAVEFEFIHPPPDDGAQGAPAAKDNALSCVLAVRVHGRQALLPADIERDVESSLVARGAALASAVLVVPHHGSRTSSTDAFLEAVAPSIAIVAAGYRNRFRHPAPDVLDRYRARGARILRSDADGAITLRFTSDGVEATTWRAARPRYWHAR